MARLTLAQYAAANDERMDRMEALLQTLVAAKVEPQASAKPAAKKAPQPKADPKPTKGSQTRETLSRKEWNRTLTAKARLAGGDTYKRVLAHWETAQDMRDQGVTPNEALASLRALAF